MAMTGAASVGLLMMVVVSLEALMLPLAASAGTSAAAVVSDDTTIIRLPSDGRGLAVDDNDDARRQAAAAVLLAVDKNGGNDDEKRPWDCCDLDMCTLTIPQICRCLDEVDRCSNDCKVCEETDDKRYVCMDIYRGSDPWPMCHPDQNNKRGGLADDARQAAPAVVLADDKNSGNDDQKRPWDCCDVGICSLMEPPICRCYDKVDRCSDACKVCKETDDKRHVCYDTYRGDPGPMCHPYPNNKRGGLADDAGKATGAVMADDRKQNAGGDDDDDKRPWKCCNVPICTKSLPPFCRCMDTVEQCAGTCEHCEQVEEGLGYRCLDTHSGMPGPRCSGEEGGGDHDWARRLARGHRF